MDNSTLELLGLSKEELQERVVEKIAHDATHRIALDDDEGEYTLDSELGRKVQEAVRERVDEGIAAIAERHILPNVTTYLENICLQETNRWGEKVGKSVTFREYLTQRAEAYLTEQVNYEGKSKSENSGYSWSATQTRITHLIEKHLHYEIKNAIEEALKNGLGTVAKAIHETCRLKINEVAANLKVNVTTK